VSTYRTDGCRGRAVPGSPPGVWRDKRRGHFIAAVATLAALPALLLASGPAAADLAAGKRKSMQCAVCHGTNGVAVNPDAPNLAGESAIYIEKQLEAFRTGARKHEQMSLIAQGLSDEDIRDLAAWFSAMTVTVTMPKMP
jgi:cytochrome c553